MVSSGAINGTGSNLFLVVLEENGAADSGNDFIVPFEGNQLVRSDLSLLGRVDVHGDWNGEEVAFAGLFGHGFHFFFQ